MTLRLPTVLAKSAPPVQFSIGTVVVGMEEVLVVVVDKEVVLGKEAGVVEAAVKSRGRVARRVPHAAPGNRRTCRRAAPRTRPARRSGEHLLDVIDGDFLLGGIGIPKRDFGGVGADPAVQLPQSLVRQMQVQPEFPAF